MAGQVEAFDAHMRRGLTTVCRCWAITRKDGVRYGFTDHDRALEFEGTVFQASSGMSAMALQQGTGLAVDNSEALGVLSDASVQEADIEAGRFDDAEVLAWLVNWADVGERKLQFRGSLGEIRRSGGQFNAELRGLTDKLNQPLGRIFQKPCTAVLGDVACGFDLSQPGYAAEVAVETMDGGTIYRWAELNQFEPGWFSRGKLEVLAGSAAGLWATIKSDRVEDGVRVVTLWEPIRGGVAAGDMVRMTAGCDKRFDSCRLKFGNLVNFQGFPDIPSEDWMMAVPKRSGANTGGSLR